ncbi:hybrid sensor histidine kinase/response regulator [Oligoflexus tunisiensis]|uniref:hybrid sensor histidine kinase/response regulator n=1 Tax=Oligoflexus tunisiensis TaxID=708132 RepID=UPI000A9F1E5C|nr:hybrid sensor histidine kinase/response regulator [Oligoflexus tunisiensis]
MALLKKPYSLSWHLVILVLSALVPAFLFSSIMVNWLGRLERQASERTLLQSAQGLGSSVDQEIEATIRTLQSLAVSVHLEQGNLEAFHAEVVRILQSQPSWLTVLVHDTEGHILINAARRYGEKLTGPADAASFKQVVDTKKPTVGHIARGPRGRHAFPIRIPVYVGDSLVYILSAVIATDSLQNIIEQKSDTTGEEWTRTIVDTQGTVAARSKNPDEFIGQPARTSFLNAIAGEDEGLVRDRAFEGKKVYIAYYRTPIAGWTASIAVPVEVLEGMGLRSMNLTMTAGIFLLIVFGGIALLYSRRLAKNIRSAADGAKVLAKGEVPVVKSSLVGEVEQLRDSLLCAAQLLQQREKDLKEHLTQAQTARAEAENANQAKSEFLANMSHELRTPLGVVLGFAELLAIQENTPAEREHCLEILQRNGQHLLRLINDILDLSKVEASKLTVENVDFSLPDLISEVIAEFKPQAMEKGIDLTVTSDGPIPEVVNSDPLRLRQIIYNILGNAIKFTEKGQVRLHMIANGRDFKLVIQDSGIGLSAEQQQRLFSPFTQADGSHTRKYGGTGLGLALSKKIAQLLGGDVQLLQSSPGLGSTFQIQIKVETSDRTKLTSRFVEPKPQAVQSIAGVKALLAEDSPDNVTLIVAHLKRAGVQVDVVENGLEAVERLKDGIYDIVLMDIQMPLMDGYQAVTRLRTAGCTLPIVALTAHALTEHKDKALAAGFSDYITKPVQPDRLISLMAGKLKPIPSKVSVR